MLLSWKVLDLKASFFLDGGPWEFFLNWYFLAQSYGLVSLHKTLQILCTMSAVTHN